MPRTYDEWMETKYGIIGIKGERKKRVRNIEERKLRKKSKSWKDSREVQHRSKK